MYLKRLRQNANFPQKYEQILHRDLKPENIMLENCFSAQDFSDASDVPAVKVLDFDLSRHRGPTEKTVTFGAISLGFMTPGQVDVTADRSLSRSTAVILSVTIERYASVTSDWYLVLLTLLIYAVVAVEPSVLLD